MSKSATAPAPDAATATDAATLSIIVRTLAPAAYWADFEPSERPSRAEKVAARRVIVHAWADIDAGRPNAVARFTVTMSDGSALPFKVWAEGILSIREGGKAYGVGVK